MFISSLFHCSAFLGFVPIPCFYYYDSVAYFDTSITVLLMITLAEYFALPYINFKIYRYIFVKITGVLVGNESFLRKKSGKIFNSFGSLAISLTKDKIFLIQ